ncbi:hypothetical protein LQR31_08950 [Chromobacterium vaccinii]|uniref:Uncharacterized protein n=1 Tax=Chromobacterium vaccinii TaxID=1108595 RepID=A0ABV0F8M3_9NEIS|nr:hypothetical protein [Chromobacterium vaccinii]MCD4484596.1 hypothetical protein [Chromobacterium vaccinii]MCD4498804.1 hypothetical protein [Chromobacterium vaccinii]
MANPLTLLMPVAPHADLIALAATVKENQPKLHAALTAIGTVHYARTMLLDRAVTNLQPGISPSKAYVLAVITEYDGSFDKYIQDFVKEVGPIFDALLRFVDGAEKLIPVANNTSAFTAFIAKNDASQHDLNQGLYQAYDATVQTILASLP